MKMVISPQAGARLLSGFALFCAASPSRAASYLIDLHAEAPIDKYTAELHGSLADLQSHYHPLATSASSTRIWTFCLESEVFFQSGRIYAAGISNSTDSLPARDTISVGTAYLYEQFATGVLGSLVPDFSYDVAGGERLQRMLWWLEEESGGVKDADMWSLLDLTFGSSALDDYTGSSVGVLNLTRHDGPGGDSLPPSLGIWRQDQIIYRGPAKTSQVSRSVSVPDGGSTFVLLAGAFLGLRLARGNFRPRRRHPQPAAGRQCGNIRRPHIQPRPQHSGTGC